MDTDSNFPAKQVESAIYVGWDDMGYGPQGKHKRWEWRKACLDNLLAGADAFKAWQDGWKHDINKDLSEVSFAAKLIYDDGNQSDVLGGGHEKKPPYALDFVGHLFAAALGANNSEFQQPALFVGATFSGNADFSSATFSGNADFSSATFSGNANFTIATFSGDADFSSATFSRYASFIRATFSGVASFMSATFSSDAYFMSATFSGNAYFRRTTFHTQCRFDNTFNNAKNEWTPESSFTRKADFENALFKNVGHFERTRFKNHTPTFRGCQIDSTRLEFSDDSYFPRDEKDENAIKNISFLKRLSDEHGQTDQALNFNAMELHAKRLQTEPHPPTFSYKAITWLYEVIADYGRSFTRPLIGYGALLVCTFIFALIHAENFSPKDCKGENWKILSDLRRKEIPCAGAPPDDKLHISGYRAAAEYTLYRAAGVLDFSDNGKATDAVARRLFGQPTEPWWMRVWGVFKAIASTALLFLAALGLRNKYRIK